MNIAIIPARGGSKRIPRKNIKEFHGKPIIAYSIEAAKESGCFDRVIVSTDDAEIATIAQRYGAEIPQLRSEKSSDDYATLHDVAVEVLGQLAEDSEIGDVALILATSPLLEVATITDVMSSIASDAFDTALAVVEYETSPDKALGVAIDGSIVRHNSARIVNRSQDNPRFYHDAGQIYAFRAAELSFRSTLTSTRCKAVKLDRMACQDIDTPSDWVLAEMKYKLLRMHR